MSLSTNELAILNALYAAGAANVSIKSMLDYLPELLASDKSGISSRLCRMRGKNLVLSETVGNSNLWTIKDEGMAAIAADMERAATAPIPELNQSDSPDILPDKQPDPIAADFAAAIEAAEEVVDAELPDFGANPPVCADAETIAAAISDGRYRYVEPDISNDLMEEANTLRLHPPFPRIKDALYVLNVLADLIGERPGMVYELDRIADYLEQSA